MIKGFLFFDYSYLREFNSQDPKHNSLYSPSPEQQSWQPRIELNQECNCQRQMQMHPTSS